MTTASSTETLREALDAAHDALIQARRELPAFSDRRGFFKFVSDLHQAQAAIVALSAAAEALVPVLPYNTPGHVCPDTGRTAMTVAEAYARADYCDRHFWTYNKEAADMGTEPWREVEGLDATTATGPDGLPVGYTLDFASGRSRDVFPPSIVYMQRNAAERAAAKAAAATPSI